MDASSSDPYAPPVAEVASDELTLPLALRELVVSWEKLRLIYNLVLAIPGLGILWWCVDSGRMTMVAAALGAFMMALGANACFFLGPLTELYWRAVFLRGRPAEYMRKLIFVGGIGLSLLTFIACAALMSFTMTDTFGK